MPQAAEAHSALILDFLDYLARERRLYREAVEDWRTSCPRLTIWEDAMDAGLATRSRTAGGEAIVEITPLGARALREAGRNSEG